MSNVLSEEKRQQVIALGRLGWPLRRIEQATGVRRETASAYLKAAGVGVRPPGAWGRRAPAKPPNEVTTGSWMTDEQTQDYELALLRSRISFNTFCNWSKAIAGNHFCTLIYPIIF